MSLFALKHCKYHSLSLTVLCSVSDVIYFLTNYINWLTHAQFQDHVLTHPELPKPPLPPNPPLPGGPMGGGPNSGAGGGLKSCPGAGPNSPTGGGPGGRNWPGGGPGGIPGGGYELLGVGLEGGAGCP